jgi:SAM-dependent methyltransferase
VSVAQAFAHHQDGAPGAVPAATGVLFTPLTTTMFRFDHGTNSVTKLEGNKFSESGFNKDGHREDATEPPPSKPSALVDKNRKFYDALWSKTYLTRPERFNTWSLISALLPTAPKRLEIGPGLRPRLPLAGTHFLDISPSAITRLNARGGIAEAGEITALPFGGDLFDLVTAFDVVEHVENERRAFAELTRVLKPDGRLIFSVPLHPARWCTFDDFVGHARRYEPAALQELIASHGLVVEKSAIFGMQSNNPRLLHIAVLGLTRRHTLAVHGYNWLFFPLGMLFQKSLKFVDGLMDLTDVHEVLLVCRRDPAKV